MIIACFLILTSVIDVAFHVDNFAIAGNSMFPTMMSGDECITINKFFFMDLEYRRNDIIVFKNDKYDVVKRIIGLPGERVEIKNSQIKINGQIVYNRAILFSFMDEVRDEILGPNEYYVLGDNRPYSQDSRHDGSIKKHKIVGRVLLRWRSWSVH